MAVVEDEVNETVGELDGFVISKYFCRSLPHIRNDRMLFNPTGNPVFARDLLIYPPDNNRSELGELC